MSPRSSTLPLYFWKRGSNSEFLRWQRSINDAKWTFLPLFLASSITFFCVTMPVFSVFFFKKNKKLFHCCRRIRYFQCLTHRNKHVCQIVTARRDVIFVIPARQTFQSYPRSFVGIDITSIFVLCFPILRQVSPRRFTGVLQGIAAGIGISNFLRAFLMMCLNSSSSGSMKTT